MEIRRRFDNGRQTSNEYILIDNPQLRMPSEMPSDSICNENHDSISKSKENSKQSPPRLFKCGLGVFKHPLTANEIKVYSYLTFRAGKDGECMPSKKEIAADCEISVSTVWRAISTLCRKGLIEVVPQTRADVYGNNGTSVNKYILRKDTGPDANADSGKEEKPVSSAPVQPECDRSRPESFEPEGTPTAHNLCREMPVFCGQKHSETPQAFSAGSSSTCPPFQPSFFTGFHDTLPNITDDTPRTMSRTKVTVNLRDIRLFSKVAGWYRRIFRNSECRKE
ncbi:helix-turn-helix domain-containing protein [Caproiciproducens galactitolivorans]|uniref:Helix-turn-helix domain-containing protein n=1 Tax=Caproiciproducens galactitolivorans TaxID=642589 RepID=A0ABT4BPM9_9FIRM|nr:helix-turn-helix domain-containing protein [Caproiciproducens galactitolivorans]MCY1712847.1 helix-turn-helix domain-containing protein [Caproiciproducens galactitolivorans]